MNKSQSLITSKVTMDARKLLSTINQGYAGQLKIVESKLQKFGSDIDRKLKLVSLTNNSLMFEDIKSNNIYRADYKFVEHQVVFENVKQIQVVDEKKSEIFNKACKELVESLEDENTVKADKIFSQLEKGFCTPKVIPESGMVKTRDGITHRINVSESIIPESIFPIVVKTIKESLISSKIVIKEGILSYNEKNVKMPISKLTLRQVNARHMKSVAESAYKSDNFGKLIKACAAHISNNNIKEAIKLSKGFFTEEQEFTLLNKSEFKTLIENSLFSIGVFNHKVIDDTTSVLWETTCFVNKDDIISEWKTAANDTKSKALQNNVKLLEEVSNDPKKFSDTYDSFIKSILSEDMSSKAVKAQAYLNMLKLVKNVVSGSDADAAVQGAVDDLVIRLESDINNIDDATLYEVEDLLATVGSDLISDVQTLGDFDKVPEPQATDEFGSGVADLEGDFAGDMGDDFVAPSVGGDIGGGDIGGVGADIGGGASDEIGGGAGPDVGGDVADIGGEAKPGLENATDAETNLPAEKEEEEIVADSKKQKDEAIVENSDYKTPEIDETIKINESYGQKPWEKDNKDDKECKEDDKKNDKECDKKEDKKEDKKVEESMIAVADSDEKLIELISKAMETDTGSDDQNKDEGELIIDGDKKPVEECDDKKPVKEDSDITDPDSKKFAGHQDDKKDHEGQKRNNPPKFSDEDYDGTGKFKNGKEKPEAGLSSATKE
jgi:hypothetical protein